MVRLFGIVPTVLLSWCAYVCASIKHPKFLKNFFIFRLVKLYKVNISEIEKDAKDFPSLGSFFIRKLKPDARPVDENEDSLISPVDGRVVTVGELSEDTMLKVKESEYSATDLLGDKEKAEQFKGGQFIVIHLRPFDYHRIHCPCIGSPVGHVYIPGRLLPVHEKGLKAFKNLFLRNRRRITILEGACGTFAFIKVGAFNVGRIPVEYEISGTGSGYSEIKSGKEFQKGEEIARFELGSTVILLFEKGRVELEELEEDQEVRMGEIIGRIKASGP